MRESNPQEPQRLRQFSGLLGVPVPNLPRMARAPGFEPGRAGLESASLSFSLRPLWMHQEGFEPPRSRTRATALQAAAEPFRPLMRGSENGLVSRRFGEKFCRRRGAARSPAGDGGAPPSTPQGNSVVKQQKKRAGLWCSPTGSRPAPDKSLRTFRDLGAGGPPPLSQFCNCRRSVRRKPSGRKEWRPTD